METDRGRESYRHRQIEIYIDKQTHANNIPKRKQIHKRTKGPTENKETHRDRQTQKR